MSAPKSSFLDKVLGRIGRLDAAGLQTVVQRLARERSFLETLFNTIEDGVLVVDEQGRVIYFNQAVTRLIGLQPDVEGQLVAELLPEVDWENISRADAAGGAHVTRHEFEVSYPRPRFLRLYAAPLDGKAAGSSGVALILHDATEARQKTFEAIESERVQALTLLAASVAHEIGNPLNALHIHLQLMEREVKKLKLDECRVTRGGKVASPATRHASHQDISRKLEQYLGVAKGEINRLDYIITQFLQAIRPAPLQLKLTKLNAVVEKTLELLQPELDNRGLMVKTRLANPLTATPIDPTQMQQVLVNLVKNAMHAMTKGGTLTLQTGENADGVWMGVMDTGGGIPQEQINRIFEPFYTTKKSGTGLGLMIVQRIVRAHGGRIEIESHVGRGTTFRIRLPLHERGPRLLEEKTADATTEHL
jgi:two-component system, sporulation sensor kinase E